jgi:DNA repair photolyase
MAIRFGWATEETWTKCTVRPHDVLRRQRRYAGTVMFPSSHDITLENYEACRTVLGNLLAVGNQVLIVSKPHLPVIQSLCEEFKAFQAQMEFRFTIGAMDNGILSVFEPFAPSFEERRDSLAYAFSLGFRTSVSIEPMLDPGHINELVAELMPFVSETIWIGKLNYLGRIPRDNPAVVEAVARLKAAQSDDKIFTIYQQLKDLPLIRWKTSVKKVVGIDSSEAAGLNA